MEKESYNNSNKQVLIAFVILAIMMFINTLGVLYNVYFSNGLFNLLDLVGVSFWFSLIYFLSTRIKIRLKPVYRLVLFRTVVFGLLLLSDINNNALYSFGYLLHLGNSLICFFYDNFYSLFFGHNITVVGSFLIGIVLFGLYELGIIGLATFLVEKLFVGTN